MNDPLHALLKNPAVWYAGRNAQNMQALPTGHAFLDRQLPGGGWPARALTEILVTQPGVGELQLVLPALARLSTNSECAWITWIAPPHLPYPPALEQAGLDLSRVLVVHPKTPCDSLWAMEQALRSGTCAAVLAWVDAIDDRSLRRLQLAAEAGSTWSVLFRPADAALQASPAALRLALEPEDNETWIRVVKSRGGRPTRLRGQDWDPGLKWRGFSGCL